MLISQVITILDRLIDRSEEITGIGANAAKVAADTFTPARSTKAFVDLWTSLLGTPKHTHDFALTTGRTPLDWYLSTQSLPGQEITLSEVSAQQSKGTLAHFRSAFPNDACWMQ